MEINEVREIGIEKEMFLIKDDIIKEPKLFGFPRDEFEFLVELRSLPSDRLYPVLTTLHHEELQYKLRANKFGMDLIDSPNKYVKKDWVDNHWEKYNLHRFDDCDYTRNIYDNIHQSHHFGVLEDGDDMRLTAGIHVHFSSRDAKTGEVIQLPIEEIVGMMDESFSFEIDDAKRNKGEWEPKAHGFEYRSLPCNANVLRVLKKSFEILRSV